MTSLPGDALFLSPEFYCSPNLILWETGGVCVGCVCVQVHGVCVQVWVGVRGYVCVQVGGGLCGVGVCMGVCAHM